jgi:hypothetical protein
MAVGRVSTANDGGVGGGETILRIEKSSVSHDLAAGKSERTRSSRNEAHENPLPRAFLTSKGIVNLPASVFLESMRLRSWQSTAGTHEVRNAANSTRCGTDRLGMTGHDDESFAENLYEFDPG